MEGVLTTSPPITPTVQGIIRQYTGNVTYMYYCTSCIELIVHVMYSKMMYSKMIFFHVLFRCINKQEASYMYKVTCNETTLYQYL